MYFSVVEHRLQVPSPVARLYDPLFDRFGLQVYMKRDDLIDAVISGNKWRKLKYALEKAKHLKLPTLLTFGGAFSNHIAATAALGKRAGFKTIGVIRGEIPEEKNPTLLAAEANGMKLFSVSRTAYHLKEDKAWQQHLRNQFGPLYLIPEGGAGFHGISGCMEILREIKEAPDFVMTAAGTGTTAAGLLLSAPETTKVWAYPALKGAGFLKEEVAKWIQLMTFDPAITTEYLENFCLRTPYHFGGYAKVNKELIGFMRFFDQHHHIKLDPVYTAKMAFGVYQDIAKGKFARGSRLLLLHTGGLQGIKGMEQRLGISIYASR